MKLPPNAFVGSGHPSVCTTASSGRLVSHTSFTPSAKICGLGDVMPRHARYACDNDPRVPSASTVTRAVMSVGGAYDDPGVPSRARPDGAVRTPTTRSPSTSSDSAGKPVKMFTPAASAFSPSQRTISQRDATWYPWLRIVGGVGRRSARLPVRKYTRSRVTGARNGKSPSVRSGNSSRNATGFTTAPDRQCSPSADAFSSTAISMGPSDPSDSFSVRTRRASSIAPASAAGPPPTNTTSMGTASVSGRSATMKRSTGSGGWYCEGRVGSEVMKLPGGVTCSMLLRLLHRVGQHRHNLQYIAHDAVVRQLEDGCLAVLVDRDDRARRAHAGQMLDRAGDAARDVQVGTHEPPGLSDLIAVRTPAIIRDGTRGAHGRVAERRGEILEQREVLGCAEAAAAAHDHRRFAQVELRVVAGNQLLRHHACRRGIERGRGVLHSRAARMFRGLYRAGPEREDRRGAGERQCRNHFAGIHRMLHHHGIKIGRAHV